ncbi:hypothetical protein ACB092_02G028600 [Castanea dentata]
MSKSTPSEPDPEAKPIFELSNKFKCLRHFDQSVGFLGFFFVSICVICGFFYLDYSRPAAERFLFPGHLDRFMSKGANKDKGVEFFGEKGGECDLFEGNWVWDENYPLYQSKDCSLLDNGFRCSENGRPDLSYTRWRWQPKDCNMPRGCYFQEGTEVKMDMNVEHAYQRSIETVANWIQTELNSSKTQVFFRTYSPVHFRGGDWKTGGNCHLETLPELGSSLSPPDSWDIVKIANSVLSAHLNTSEALKVEVLNITHMTAQRRDGHSSIYYQDPKKGPAPLHRQDCSHWCLPGVPDTWNELLYALFVKHVTTSSCNSSRF